MSKITFFDRIKIFEVIWDRYCFRIGLRGAKGTIDWKPSEKLISKAKAAKLKSETKERLI